MNQLSDRLAFIYEQIPTLEGDRGQIGISKATGASKSLVNQWVSGAVKTMGLEWALRLESRLGFSHIWLMAGLGEPMAKDGQRIVIEGAENPEPLLTLAMPRELELLDLFRRSTDQGQDDIVRTARIVEKRPTANVRSVAR